MVNNEQEINEIIENFYKIRPLFGEPNYILLNEYIPKYKRLIKTKTKQDDKVLLGRKIIYSFKKLDVNNSQE